MTDYLCNALQNAPCGCAVYRVQYNSDQKAIALEPLSANPVWEDYCGNTADRQVVETALLSCCNRMQSEQNPRLVSRSISGTTPLRLSLWLDNDDQLGVFAEPLETGPLKESKDLNFQSLFNHSLLISLLINPSDGSIVDANRAACNFYGYSRTELSSMKISQLNTLPPEQVKQLMQEAHNGISNDFSFQHRLKSGEIRHVQVFSSRVQLAARELLHTVVIDKQEQVESEQELLKLQKAVEQSPAVVVITDTTGNIEYANPVFYTLTGYTPQEVLGQNPRILKSGHTPPEEYHRLWQTISSGGVWTGTFLNRKKDGNTYWESAVISPVKNNKGETTHYLAVKDDITQRVTAEQRLEQEHNQLRSLLDSIPELIYVADIDSYEILFTNRHMRELLGRDVTGEKCYNAIQQTDKPCQFCTNRQILDSDEPVFWEHYNRFLNKHFYIIDRAITWTDGRRTRFEMAVDITAQKDAEQKLRASEAQYRLLAENISDVIWVLNVSRQQFTYISPSVERLRGFTVEEAMQQSIDQALAPESARIVYEDMTKTVQEFTADPDTVGSKFFIHQLQQTCKDGSLIWIETSTIYRYNEQQEIEVIGISRDITERKNYEKKLRISRRQAEEANRAKSEFLANMSHEIRTPLNSVIGFTELLETTGLSPIQKQYLTNVHTASRTLLDIINDVLDLSKIEAGKLELDPVKTDLPQLLEQALDIVNYAAAQKDLELLLDLSGGIPRFAVIDPLRVKQILINLLSNAVKFTGQGEVELKVTFQPEGEQQGKFEFSVRDTGIGISQEQQQRLFKAFSQADPSTTRQYGGTGLGLVISDLLARKMGDRIHLQSNPGQGSTFSFSVLTGFECGAELPPGEENELNRVMVIDDNSNNRRILCEILQQQGIECTPCSTGREALKLLAKADPYDAIIVDYHMPDLDGLSTVGKIRHELNLDAATQPVILLHSSAEDNDLFTRSRELGIQIKLTKPVTARSLLYHLKNLQKHQMEPAEADELEQLELKTGFTPVILIAEDNPMNMKLITTLLQQLLPDVVLLKAGNGEQAVELALRHRPDLILMDIQMPKLDGLQATQAIRQTEKESEQIPIVALTAGATKEERDKSRKAGMDGFLTKPIEQPDLRRILIRQLKGGVMSAPQWEPAAAQTERHRKKHHFDRQRLIDKLEDDMELFNELVKDAMAQFPSYLETLTKEVDPTTATKTAHTIKGAARNLYLDRLADSAEQLEQLYRHIIENRDKVGAVTDELKQIWQITADELSKEI